MFYIYKKKLKYKYRTFFDQKLFYIYTLKNWYKYRTIFDQKMFDITKNLYKYRE